MKTVTARYTVQFQTNYDPDNSALAAHKVLEACKALRLLIGEIDPGLTVHLAQVDDEVFEIPDLQR